MAGVWTRNYSNLLAWQLGSAQNVPNAGNETYSDDNLSFKSCGGNIIKAGGLQNLSPITFPKLDNLQYRVPNNNYTSTNYYAPIICFGTGDTAPSFEDYNIESGVSSFTVSQRNIVVSKLHYDSTAHTYSTTYRFVLQYTGSPEITLKEMVIGGTCGVTSPSRDVIIYREVFDTPITVNQYESIVVELTQAFPIINYEPYPE